MLKSWLNLRSWLRDLRCRQRQRILVWGDSNSEIPSKYNCWPAILEKAGGKRFCVLNDSVSGRTTGFDRGKLNSRQCFDKRIKKYGGIDYLFIMLGTNDVKMRYGPPKSEEIAENLNTIANLACLHHPNVNLAILLPPPIGSDLKDDFLKADNRIKKVCLAIRHTAAQRGVDLIDIHSVLKLPVHFDKDAIHLNSAGRYIIAQTVMKYLVNK